MNGAQAATVNCKKCHTAHFTSQLFGLNYKCQNCHTPFEKTLNPSSSVEILQETVVRLAERIEGVEAGLENYREYRTAIEDLQTDLMYAKERMERLERENHTYKLKAHEAEQVAGALYRKHISPHQCPVCSGAGFTLLNITAPTTVKISGLDINLNYRSEDLKHIRSKCQPCDGSGVLWK